MEVGFCSDRRGNKRLKAAASHPTEPVSTFKSFTRTFTRRSRTAAKRVLQVLRVLRVLLLFGTSVKSDDRDLRLFGISRKR